MSASNGNLVYLCVFVLFFLYCAVIDSRCRRLMKEASWHGRRKQWRSTVRTFKLHFIPIITGSCGSGHPATRYLVLYCAWCSQLKAVNQSIGILINAKQSIALILRQGCPFFRKQNNYLKCTDSQQQLSLKCYPRECISSPCLLPLVNQVTLKFLTSAVHAHLHLSDLCVCRCCYETWRLALVWGTKRWVLTGAPEHKDKRMTRTTTPCSKNKQTPHFNFLFCAEPSKHSASILWVETERNGNKPKFRLNHPTSVCSSLQRSNE